ncbi:MAG: hypothetical protein GF393_09260, partial [Armatimonadia bacterium]|nr:hypothetical protein [Armatimonadia bacterium]
MSTFLKTSISIAVLVVLAACCAFAQIELLPGAFFTPGDFGAHELESGRTQLRYGRDYLLYVREPGEVTVTIGCVKIGRSESEAEVTVLAEAGADIVSATAPVGGQAQATFTARRVGPYDLRVEAGRNAFTLGAEGAGVLLPASSGGQPFHGIRRAAPIYLFVPPGAREFTVELTGQGTGETAKAHLFGPDGNEVALLNTTGQMSDSRLIEVPEGADDAVWAMTIEKGDDGIFEDFEVALSGDVSPYV